MGTLVRGLAALVLLTVLGCGVGLEDSGSDSARNEKNQKLQDEYEAIKGTYEGNIRITGVAKPFPVKFYLFWGEVHEAPLPGDLKPGIRVVLRGRLMQSEFVGDSDNLILKGLYDSETGRISLLPDVEASRTSTGCRLGGVDPLTISGYLSGETLTGSVLRNDQEWAKFENVRRTSRDVSSGAILSEEEEYRRLEDIYRPVTGMYRGSLQRQVCSNKTRDEEIELWMYIDRLQEGTGLNGAPCFVPRLTARMLRTYSGSHDDIMFRSIPRFDPRSLIPQFMSSYSKMNLDYDGKSVQLSGPITTTGTWGTVNVTRYRDTVTAPQSEVALKRERLMRTFSLFTAVYKGKVNPFDKSKKAWPVDLNLYTDETVDANGVVIPNLKALYRRLDFSDPTIGARLMDVQVVMDGCNPVLTMKSEPDGNGKIPGVGLMRFSSEYLMVNGKPQMQGELVDHRGPQGTMTVTK